MAGHDPEYDANGAFFLLFGRASAGMADLTGICRASCLKQDYPKYGWE